MPRDRREQDGIELVRDRHVPAVQRRERRAGACDAEGESLVEQLVRHHVPVGDASGRDGQGRRSRRPEREHRQEARGAHEDVCTRNEKRARAQRRLVAGLLRAPSNGGFF